MVSQSLCSPAFPRKTKKIPWDFFKGKMEMADDFDAPLEAFKDYM